MTNTEFKDNIYTALQSDASLEVLLKILRSFKESGGKQEEAYLLLIELTPFLLLGRVKTPIGRIPPLKVPPKNDDVDER